MAKYKIKEFNILDIETGKYIPLSEGNRSYKEYLKWLAEGNTPDPFETQQEIDERLAREAEQIIEDKIQNKIREFAINDLKDKGELPPDYVDKYKK